MRNSGLGSVRLIVSFVCLILFVSGGLLHGGVLREGEYDNESINNTFASAQTLGPFERNENPNVFGHKYTASVTGYILGGDVDWFKFYAHSGEAWFDLDSHAQSYTNTALSLYDDTGTMLAHANNNHSGGTDPGSRDTFDPFLGVFDIPDMGWYYLALVERVGPNAQVPNGHTGYHGGDYVRPDGRPSGSYPVNGKPGVTTYPSNTPQPATADNFNTGAYTLHVSGNMAPQSYFAQFSGYKDPRIGSAVFGGATIPGGIDMFMLDSQSGGYAQVEKITDKSDLPAFEGFVAAGEIVQAWDIKVTAYGHGYGSMEYYFGYDEGPILAAGIDEADLQIFHFTNGEWVGGGVVDPEYNEIMFMADSSSPFVVGVVPEPSSMLLLALGSAMALRRRRVR